MSEKIPSKYQVAIYNEYKNTNNNIFIGACPGSGKSHVLRELAKITPFYKKTIMVAFNKSIAEELRTKVPSNIETSTMHSLGFKILRKNVYGRFKLNEIKTYILAKKCIEDPFKERKNGKKLLSIYLFTISKLYDLYRMNLSPKEIGALELLADEYSVETFEPTIFMDTIKVIDYIDNYNNCSHKEMMIDFTDMLWLPYKLVDANYFPKYDVGMYDEVQDANPLQREIFLRIIKPNGKYISVGDEKQAIYSFMGSNLNSFNTLKELPNTTVLPLSVSYRCGSNIVNYANSIFGGMEAFEGNPEGIVRFGRFKDITEGDMLLCRNNLPLIESFLTLLDLGKKSHILGRDFGKALQNLVNSIDSVEDLDKLLSDKVEKLTKRGVGNPYNHKSFIALKEKVDIILMLVNVKDYTLEEVVDLFNTLFTEDFDSENSVTLSTIHKAKGLERDRVIWLYPELIPSTYATTELELYQEKCLIYVAITRAINELIIIKQG